MKAWYISRDCTGDIVVNPYGDPLPPSLHFHLCPKHVRPYRWICEKDDCPQPRLYHGAATCPNCLRAMMEAAR